MGKSDVEVAAPAGLQPRMLDMQRMPQISVKATSTAVDNTPQITGERCTVLCGATAAAACLTAGLMLQVMSKGEELSGAKAQLRYWAYT